MQIESGRNKQSDLGDVSPSTEQPPIVDLLHTETLIDNLLLHTDSFHPADELIARRDNCSQHINAWRAWQPLWCALQTARAQCQFCSPIGRLSVLNITDSGSTAEGLSDHAKGRVSSSDFDYMYELGDVSWFKSGAAVEMAQVNDAICSSPPVLAAVFRKNSRDTILWQVRTPNCEHKSPLKFHPDIVRQLMFDAQKVRHATGQVTVSGPATAVSRKQELHAGVDHVPCLRLPTWPSEEFANRKRLNQWPPADAREDICAFGVHLVPIGGHGSPGELSDWRVSFSRSDIVAAWHLTAAQRAAAKAVKKCKNVLRGDDDCALKSYFIKTAMFWLCQDAPIGHWNSVTQAAQMIVSFLERAVENGRLECFFWANVNLFDYREAELPEMKRMILRIKMNMKEILASDCTQRMGSVILPLVSCPSAVGSEGLRAKETTHTRGFERPSGTRWEYGTAVKNGVQVSSWRQELEMQLEFDLESLLMRKLGIEKWCAENWAREWRKAIIKQTCVGGERRSLGDEWSLMKFACRANRLEVQTVPTPMFS